MVDDKAIEALRASAAQAFARLAPVPNPVVAAIAPILAVAPLPPVVAAAPSSALVPIPPPPLAVVSSSSDSDIPGLLTASEDSDLASSRASSPLLQTAKRTGRPITPVDLTEDDPMDVTPGRWVHPLGPSRVADPIRSAPLSVGIRKPARFRKGTPPTDDDRDASYEPPLSERAGAAASRSRKVTRAAREASSPIARVLVM